MKRQRVYPIIRQTKAQKNSTTGVLGVCFRVRGRYVARWRDADKKQRSKCFHVRDYTSAEEALEAAASHRSRMIQDATKTLEQRAADYLQKQIRQAREENEEERKKWRGGHPRKDGSLMNQWRIIEDGVNVEMRLNDGKTAIFPIEFLAKVLPLRWYLHTYAHTTWTPYVRSCTTLPGEKKQKQVLLHKFLYPEIPEPRDHKDGNGLNNRRDNIRRGDGGLNGRYRNGKAQSNSKTGVLGVSFRIRGNWSAYIAAWNDANGKVQSKTFSVNRFPSRNAALEVAKEYRNRKAQEVIDEIEARVANLPRKRTRQEL